MTADSIHAEDGMTVTTVVENAYQTDMTLLASPAAVSLARKFVARHATAWGLAEMQQDLMLVIAELAGNAVAVSTSDDVIKVAMRRDRGGVLLKVWDTSDRRPVPCEVSVTLKVIDAVPPDHEFGGWGLSIVSHLCDQWGIKPTPPKGKWVWGHVSRTDNEEAQGQKSAHKGEGRSRRTLQNGHAIRYIRKTRGLTGAETARALRVSPGTLCNIEVERRSASLNLLVRIAEMLGVPPEVIKRDQVG